MKVPLILTLVSSPTLLFAQGAPVWSTEPTPHASSLTFASEVNGCAEGKQLAEKDIAERRPCLLLAGGIAPVAYATDKSFAKEFGVRYLENGCSGPATSCTVAYDARVFQYLTENFGRTWRKKIRKDVLGLAEWQRKN